MIFPHLPIRAARTVTIDGLSGGLNTAARDTLAANQLHEAANVWWKEGKLRTRPGLSLTAARTAALADAPETGIRIQPFEGSGGAPGVKVAVMRQVTDESAGPVRQIRTGVCRPDGSFTLHSDPLPGTYPTDGDCPVTVVDYAAAGGDGSLVFTRDGHIYLPPAESGGSYTDLRAQAYVPLLLRDGRGVCEAEADEIPLTGAFAEDKNLLTGAFRAHFSTDGTADAFRLPLQGLDDAPVTVALTLGGDDYSFTIPAGSNTSNVQGGFGFTVDRASGLLRCFEDGTGSAKAPPLGLTDNLRVTATRTETDADDRVFGMRFGVWFGGEGEGEQGGARLFLSGHPDYPNEVRWSAPDNPLYFPAHGFGRAGDPSSAVTAFGRQGDRLIVFKEHELYALSGTAGRLAPDPETGIDPPENAVRFPIEPVHAGVGCDLPRTIRLCGDRLVWATSARRVYMLLTATAYSDTAVRELSGSIASELEDLSASVWKDAFSMTFDGHYLLWLGLSAYLFCYESPAFERYVYVYDDTAAQQKLAWYSWIWPDTLGSTPLLPVSGGDEAALLALAGGRFLCGYRLEGAQDTAVEDQGGSSLTLAGQEIYVSAETGLLCGDEPCRRGTVRRVWLDLTALSDAPVVVTYLTPQGALTDTLTPVRGEQETVCLSPQLSGARRFGLRVRSTGGLVLGRVDIEWR